MRFDYDSLAPGVGYKLMNSTITPRPIAWVSTLGASGVVNVAPYSFFNAMGSAPPTIALGVMAHPTKGYKDTSRNILDTQEFCVNLVPQSLVEAMNLTCVDAPEDVSEMELAGLEAAPCHHIKAPRIAASPVSFECRVQQVIETGPQQLVVIGLILALHLEDRAILDAERGHVDTPVLDLVGRMHGSGWYTRTQDMFQLERPVWPLAKS